MKINEKKLARQRLSIDKWLANMAIGIVEAITGFGKTFIAILLISDMNKRHPDRTTIVVVPTQKLKDDWLNDKQVFDENGKLVKDYGHIKKHGLKNVQVFVVNTFTKYENWVCDLLILDEVHHYANSESKFFSTVLKITKYRFGLGLTATLEEKERQFLLNEAGWGIVDTITEAEAVRDGYVSSSITYNLGIRLSPEDVEYLEKLDDKVKSYMSRFDHNFNLMAACSAGKGALRSVKHRKGHWMGRKTKEHWCRDIALSNGWTEGKGDSDFWSPKNIAKYAALGMRAIQERKGYIYNCKAKLSTIKRLVNQFRDRKIVVFSESTSMANNVREIVGKGCRTYHSKLTSLMRKGDEEIPAPRSAEEKKAYRKRGYEFISKGNLKEETINLFQSKDSGINVLSAVRALDEGFDVESIDMIIQAAYTSTKRQDRQRKGRGIRIDNDNLSKKTIVVNVYLKDTQEEKWLKNKQKESGVTVHWIDSVSEVRADRTINLAA